MKFDLYEVILSELSDRDSIKLIHKRHAECLLSPFLYILFYFGFVSVPEATILGIYLRKKNFEARKALKKFNALNLAPSYLYEEYNIAIYFLILSQGFKDDIFWKKVMM